MKHALLAIAIATGITANAQRAVDPKPAEPVNLHLAGQHLERAGKQRNTGLFIGLGLGAVAAMVGAVDPDNAAPAAGLAVVGLGIGIGFNLSANGNERRAGRILQGR